MRRRIYTIVFGILLLGVVGFLCFYSDEPSYQGRTLSDWLEEYASATRLIAVADQGTVGVLHSGTITPAHERRKAIAIDAINHIGPKAIPHLFKWMDYKQSANSARLCNYLELYVENHNGKAKIALRILKGLERPVIIHHASVYAFGMLGPSAEAAIPELTKRLKKSDPFAGDALAFMGPQGLPPLIELLADTSRTNRNLAASCIGEMGTNGRPAAPLLISCLLDDDLGLRETAFYALYDVKPDPALVIPKLIDLVADTKIRTPNVIGYLSCFGPQASNAVPVLIQALKDPDPEIRDYATNALQEINPSALENLQP